MTAPPERGLFARAAIQSGSCPTQTQTAAQASAQAFAQALGCSDAACLRAKPDKTLLDATQQPAASATVDGAQLPVAPADAVASGNYTHVPLLIGTNHNEGRTFAPGLRPGSAAARSRTWPRSSPPPPRRSSTSSTTCTPPG